jgi:hypothetical protein
MVAGAPSVDIAAMIATAGLGTFAAASGWSIAVGGLPTAPDSAISVTDSGGDNPHPAMKLDQPSVQVLVRGAQGDYTGGWAKAEAIKWAILGASAQTINSTRYGGFEQKGDTALIHWDESRRPIFTLNFRVTREPTGGNRRSF